MSLKELHIGTWEALEEALLCDLEGQPGEDPFVEQWVVVPHAGLVRHLQHRVAERLGALCGLRFLRLEQAARRAEAAASPAGPHPLDRMARDLLFRQVLRERMSRMRELLGEQLQLTPSLLEAAAKSVYDLREAGIEPDRLYAMSRGSGERSGARLRAVGELLEGYLDALRERGVQDDEGLLRTAAARTGTSAEQVVGVFPQMIRVYGFYDLTGGQQALVDAWISGGLRALFLPWFPESEAYAGGLRKHWEDAAEKVTVHETRPAPRALLGFDGLTSRLGATDAPTCTLISAPGRGREVDTVLRLLAGAWTAGVPGSEASCTTPIPDAYRQVMEDEARSAGIPGSGSPKALRGLLLAMLDLASGPTGMVPVRTVLRAASGWAGSHEMLAWTGPSGREGERDLAGWIASMESEAQRLREPSDFQPGKEASEGVRAAAESRRRFRGLSAERLEAAATLLRGLGEVLSRFPTRGGGWEVWREGLEEALLSLGLPEEDLPELAGLEGLEPVQAQPDIEAVRWVIRRLPALEEERGPAPGHLMGLRGTSPHLNIIMGLAEGSWPSRPGQDPLLLDRERQGLRGGSPWLLSDASRRISEQRLLFRLATCAGRHLVLLYPRLDEDGTTRRPSPHILSLLEEITGEPWDAARAHAEARRGTRSLGRIEPLPHEHLLGALDRDMAAAGAAIKGKDPGDAGLYALWCAPSFRWGWHAEQQRWRGGPGPWSGFLEDGPVLEAVESRLGLDEGGSLSASLLQDYALCPWKVMAARVLGLDPEEEEGEGMLDGAEMGSVLHQVMRSYVAEAAEAGRWPPVPGQEREDSGVLADRVRAEVGRAYRAKGLRAAALQRVDTRRAHQRLLSWLAWESGADAGEEPLSQPSGAGWEAEGLEEAFESLLGTVPPVRLKGRWDRVDRGPGGRVRIVDYKTGRARPPKEGEVEGGLGLQMPLYLLAAASREGGERIEGGVFIHLDPSRPGRDPYLRAWEGERVASARGRLERLVQHLCESMRAGIFFRYPHPRGEDNRTGLCRGCPSPDLCRAWREEEALRHVEEDLLIRLHAARRMEKMEGET